MRTFFWGDAMLLRPFSMSIAMLLLPATICCAAETSLPRDANAALTKYCADCHSGPAAEARIDLAQMAAAADVGRGFKDWEKVIRMLRQGKMPPADAPQPSPAERTATVAAIEKALDEYAAMFAGDPGAVVLRRLTSAEYGYTLQDLTGLDLKLYRTIAGDAAGGEGFTNVGGAQFIQDSSLERYLEAAKLVANHAVIGAGPLSFYGNPGQTGRELSAINRIKEIYRAHGFRTAAGEGATPFGLDLYPRAMFVAWQYRHRAALGQKDAALADLARAEQISPRLCEHVWRVLSVGTKSFPLAAIVGAWQGLPGPNEPGSAAEIRSNCQRLARELRAWQSSLAANAGDEEEAAVLTEGAAQVRLRHPFTTTINWSPGAKTAEFELAVSSANGRPATGALVLWRNPRLRLRRADNRRQLPTSLATQLTPDSLEQIKAAQHPRGMAIGKDDFVQRGGTKILLTLAIPEGMLSARLEVEAELDVRNGDDGILRCTITDRAVEGATAADTGAASVLLADPASPLTAEWKAGVSEFARLLPEVSQREAAPSDRDPIPLPFDGTYNTPERNLFHYAIKYYRDDRFLYDHILDDAARAELDQAWTDLLTAFEYHDASLRFLAKKYQLDLKGQGIADVDSTLVASLPAEPRSFIERWQREYRAMQQALQAAEPGHLVDALQFAQRAWRRPLAVGEQQRLREFYAGLRREGGLAHVPALRTLLARILVAPAFLYRAEPLPLDAGVVQLSDWELASRLSYFLWSSQPDDELRRAAAAGELRQPEQLAAQARRMLKDEKARRLAAEFFGQWLGFYRFDEFAGIDAQRFPEFDEPLKAALYDEAVSFFEHIVRADRPPAEILFADYTFVNQTLAKHYGLAAANVPADRAGRVAGISGQHRGGILGMGAVLSVTSAPLRTSAVKRGDWLLRRVLGTPVPPPPADAGSIPAEEALADELTVRQRLEKHRTAASCVNCHARMDPLGFALEHYDSLGRWRDTYQGDKPIDTSGTLSDGTPITGLESLREYLRRQQPQFERNLSGKLLGYALGRTELASDRPLLHQMQADLSAGGGFSALVVRIVISPQFRNRRP